MTTTVLSVPVKQQRDGEFVIDLPADVVFALKLKAGDTMVWTRLPGGFSVRKETVYDLEAELERTTLLETAPDDQ